MVEPIEQNVQGSNGIYELIYFMKESRSLDKYKTYVKKFEAKLVGKTELEIEKLVSLPSNFEVLAHIEFQSSALWSRRTRLTDDSKCPLEFGRTENSSSRWIGRCWNFWGHKTLSLLWRVEDNVWMA
jgi:hypothetical protein